MCGNPESISARKVGSDRAPRLRGFGVWSLVFRIEGLGLRVWGLGFGVQGSGFGAWSLGSGFEGLGIGVWGLGVRV